MTQLTFELSILPVFIPKKIKPRLDNRVSKPIEEIFKEFIFNLPENVTIYICDSSDGRHKTRERLFNSWFNAFQENEAFTKIDVALDRKRPNDIAFFVILHRNNLYKDKILNSLEQLKEDYEQNH